ncbi:hypothetical protein M569_03122, partial [Genlisea aurea]
IFISLFFALVLLFRRKGSISRNRAKKLLPPGSMGWPYIGETLQLYSQHPNAFISTRQKRYGEIFKSHILGCPCVMLSSPEAVWFVLVTRANLFRPTYPKSKENLIGPSAMFFHQGIYHNHLRKVVQTSLLPQALKIMVSGIEKLAVSALCSISDAGVVNTYAEMKKLSFEVGILSVFGYLEVDFKEELKKNYGILDRGYNSFPTNFKYQKAVKARKKLSEILREIVKRRREEEDTGEKKKDLLSCLLNFNGEAPLLSEEQIADNVIGVLFAAKDTTASAMTWVIKFLHDNPNIYQTVKDEQEAIHEANSNGRRRSQLQLSWKQTRNNMPFTYRVVLESLRVASILSFTFREAVEDVDYKAGYVIPKGWKVMPLFRSIHHNGEFFPDPQKFDPSRFEKSPKPNTFMPFGSGTHACPGNELAKMEILVLIHYLVTNFRYELVESHNEIEYGPFPVPLHGLPARF